PLQAGVLVVGVADEVEGRLGRAAHGVHVAEGVGGGNLPVAVRVVDDRREKGGGLDDRQGLGELVDAGVVVRLGAHEEVGIVVGRQAAKNLRNPLGGELARSTRAGGVVDQTFLAAEK